MCPSVLVSSVAHKIEIGRERGPLVVHDAGIVHENIQPAMLLGDFLEGFLDARRVRHVHLQELDIQAKLLEFRDSLLPPHLIPGRHENMHTLPGKLLRDLEPQPFIGPTDKRDLLHVL
jgi:hypothetical protein